METGQLAHGLHPDGAKAVNLCIFTIQNNILIKKPMLIIINILIFAIILCRVINKMVYTLPGRNLKYVALFTF